MFHNSVSLKHHGPSVELFERHRKRVDRTIKQAGEPSPVADWQPILARLGLAAADARHVEARAKLAGVPFQAELLASGLVSERDLFQQLAAELGLAYSDVIDPKQLVMREAQGLAALSRRGGVRIATALSSDRQSFVLIAPDRADIPALRTFALRYPRAARRIVVVPPSLLRRAVARRARSALTDIAISGLFETRPQLSARFVVNAWQGAVLGSLAAALVFCAFLAPGTTLFTLHCLASVVFFACVVLRLMIGASVRRTQPPKLGAMTPAEMPVYTVLVALYKEAAIVPDLLVALGRIVWPRAKLEIKLVCESDDTETLEALRAQELRPSIEIIEVPPEGPRTKPKALSYALPMTSGEFVVLYDAEDRPHPFQLIEAWQRFRKAGGNLGCVQAPLMIANRAESWVSSMFGLEYAALFRGVLPWLAKRGLVLPLGGTSNHFRRTALERVGGWDPYNVTEDADLGIRLHRFGYRTDVISSPTFEDAPTEKLVWIRQRTRWFKGWAQTWLVHMRNPRALMREMGRGSFVITQILVAGMVLSALAYSMFLATIVGIAIYIAISGAWHLPHLSLLVLDTANIVLGHGAFLQLGHAALSKPERHGFWKLAISMPFYWTLMSLAAWRCVWQLYRSPHHWEKTPHTPTRSSRKFISGNPAPVR